MQMNSRRDIALEYFNKHQEFMDTVVAQNIERYRKGCAELKFTDKDENPIKNVHFRIKQKRKNLTISLLRP